MNGEYIYACYKEPTKESHWVHNLLSIDGAPIIVREYGRDAGRVQLYQSTGYGPSDLSLLSVSVSYLDLELNIHNAGEILSD